MEYLAYIVVVLVFVAGIILYRSWHSVRSLHARSVAELRQLQELLAERHLILSHLLDSLPASFDSQFNRTELSQRLGESESFLSLIDPDNPIANDIRRNSRVEQSLYGLVRMLTETIAASESVRESQTVVGCLKGLDASTLRMTEATSSYNTSVITLTSYLASPHQRMIARWTGKEGDFCVFDWGSDSSEAAFAESNR
ncbi:MAG: hypothetical protein AB8B91_13675 [Rubripirellula sp.]